MRKMSSSGSPQAEQARSANMARAIDWIVARAPLRVSRERAVDTLWTLAAPDVARMLFEL